MLITKSLRAIMNNEDIPHYERDGVYLNEIYAALVTGTRPVYLQENEDAYIWGSGTLFLAYLDGYQFAVTAKHVFTKVGGNPAHTRILMPGYQAAIPLAGAFHPDYSFHPSKDVVEDITVLHIAADSLVLEQEDLKWRAWNMDRFAMPATSLEVGQQVFAVGYPSFDDRYDYDAMKLNETPMIAIGMLASTQIMEGVYTIDCAEFDRPFAGSSGGPVFARFNGFFCYVGMMVMGTPESRKIHFIDGGFVIGCMKLSIKKIISEKAKAVEGSR